MVKPNFEAYSSVELLQLATEAFELAEQYIAMEPSIDEAFAAGLRSDGQEVEVFNEHGRWIVQVGKDDKVHWYLQKKMGAEK